MIWLAARFTEYRNRREKTMVRTPRLSALYAIMLLACVGGLMGAVQIAPIAHKFQDRCICRSPLPLSLVPLLNGAGRIAWGWISDHWGRARTMAVAFLLQALFWQGLRLSGARDMGCS